MSNTTIAAEAFEGCDLLTEVVAPDELTSIGDRAFKSCKTLVEFTQPSNALKTIGKEAFSQCKQLPQIAIGNDCDTIETSAFTDDVSLTSLDRFSQEHAKYPFDIVGDYAFSNCGFKKLNLSLRSSTIYTFWGDNCFADNTQLEEVNFLSSCYMSTRMFANCGLLKRVNFKNNHTSYVYPYTFENCVSLTSITLPSKIWYISEMMFHNCQKLKEVKFNTYDASGSMVSLVQRNAFNGCNSLTSIEFPASLDKLEYFDDACLSGIFERHDLTIDRLDSITLNFHGIPISSIYAEGNAMLTSDVCYGQMYDIWTDDDLAALQLKKIDEETAKTSADTIIFVSGCYKKSDGTFTYEVVPKKNNSKWFAEYAATADGRDWLAHRKCIFVHIHYVLGTMTASYDYKTEKKRMLDIKNNVITKKNYSVLPDAFQYIFASSPFATHFKDFFTGTKFQDLTVFTYALVRADKKHKSCRWSIDTMSELNTLGNDIKSSYNKKASQVSVFLRRTADIFQRTGMFRLNHDATVIDMNTVKYSYKYNAAEVQPYVEPVNYHVDMTTKTDFKVGTWYYRAKELKEWADKTHTPCLFIYSLLGCKPCQVYQKNIWNNAGFQAWAKQQKFYLCGMEVEKQPYYDESLKFCSDELSPNALNYQKAGGTKTLQPNVFGQTFQQFYSDGNYNSNLMTPVLVFYYNNGKETKCFDYTFHAIDTHILNYGAEGVIQCLKSLCLYHFDNNSLSNTKFVMNAGKEFVLYDWTKSKNPYRISEDTISLNDWEPIAGNLTTQNVLKQMANILSRTGAQSDSYPNYIGGCLWGDIIWIQLTFDTNNMTGMDAAQCNAELKKFKIQIGKKLYYLQVNSSGAKKNINTPCGASTLYKYTFKDAK